MTWGDVRIPAAGARRGGPRRKGEAPHPDRSRLVALLALLVFGSACAPGPEPDAPPPHIVLFTADTLRPDHLSLSGYPRATSPHLDRFAREAWHFPQALSVVAKTLPSFATLFSGRHPRVHGVRSNFAQAPRGLPLLAERLRDAGYRTAAFVGNPVLREHTGLLRGFDTHEIVLPLNDGVGRLLDAFERWLEADWDRPTFVWIHSVDPHGPYRPPERYEELFLDDEWARSDARVPKGFAARNEKPEPLGKIPRYQRRGSEDRIAPYVARYDAEIRWMDAAFGRVIEHLRAKGLYDGSAVIFTSDHGESLGEHDYYFEHGRFAYEPGLRIPLLIKTPGQTQGHAVEVPVSNLDLLPTLLALARVAPEGIGPGVDLLGDAETPGGRTHVVASADSADPVVGLRAADAKYLRHELDGREELYDLREDPGETVDLSGERTEQTRALREQLDRRLEELDAARFAPEPDATDDPETLERLRELGYVE